VLATNAPARAPTNALVPRVTKIPLAEAIRPLGLQAKTLKQLSDAKITSVEELRKQIFTGKSVLTNLPADQVKTLQRVAILFLLSTNTQLNAKLATNKFSSVKDLATNSVEELQKWAGTNLTAELAKQYKKRAVGLSRFMDQKVQHLAIAGRNPSALESLPPADRHIAQQLAAAGAGGSSNPDACAGACGDEEIFFTPAVYLIYLLDFIKKSFPLDLASLTNIDKRFYQRFEQLPLSREVGVLDSYVRFSNDVLENLIAAYDGKPFGEWPHDVDTTPAQRLERRAYIYDTEFKAAAYASEPGFNTNLVSELFDSYVREIGTTRRDMRIIAGVPHETLKLRLAFGQGINLSNTVVAAVEGDVRDGLRITDIPALALESINLAALEAIREKKIGNQYGALYRWHRRKASIEVAQEFMEAIREEKRIAFEKHFRGVRAAAIDCVTIELLKTIPNDISETEYEEKMASRRRQATDCVNAGTNCPSAANCTYGGNPFTLPLIPLRELFRHYADVFPAPESVPAAERTISVRPDTREADARATLLTKECWQRFEKELRYAEGLTNNEALPKKAAQRIAERLASDEEFERQIDRLAKAAFQRESTGEGRQAFLDEVERRADEAWRASVAKAESGYLAKIRANLIAIVLHKRNSAGAPGTRPPASSPSGSEGPGTRPPAGNPTGAGGPGSRPPGGSSTAPPGPGTSPSGQAATLLLTDENIRLLSADLFLDLRMDESNRTTPIALAISRIHSLIQAAQLGKVTFQTNKLDREVWSWLQSYGTWHAAMMVTAYPESFLMPEIRRSATPQFRAAMDAGDEDPTVSAKSYSAQIEELRDMDVLATATIGGRVFIFGRSLLRATGTGQLLDARRTYYSVLTIDGRWKPWMELPGAATNPLFTRQFDVVLLNERLFLFQLKDPNRLLPSLSALKQLQYLSFVVEGDTIKGAGQDTPPAEGAAADAWQDIGDSISMWGSVRFAVSGPYYVGLEYRSIVVLVGRESRKLGTKVLILSENGSAQLLSHPVADEHVHDNMDLAGMTLDVKAVRDFGETGTFANHSTEILWNIDGVLYIGAAFLVREYGQSMNLSLLTKVGGVPKLRDQSRISAIFPDGNKESFLLFYQPADSGSPYVSQVKWRRSPESWDSTASYLVPIPDGTVDANGLGMLGGDTVVFGKPTGAQWKQYYFKGTTGPAINISIPELPEVHGEQRSQSQTFDLFREWDQSRLYFEEGYLHIPMMVAQRLSDAGRYEEALAWLSRVYDPMAESEANYPGLGGEALSINEIGRWLTDPFDPHALANMNGGVYLYAIKLAHVQNLIDWADKLFTRDTTESVNRARQLYELAAHILSSTEWSAGDCAIDFRILALREPSLQSAPSLTMMRVLDQMSRTTREESTFSLADCRKALAAQSSAGFKLSAVSSLFDANRVTSTTLKSVLERRSSSTSRHKEFELELLMGVTGGISDSAAEKIGRTAEKVGDVDIGQEFPQVDLRFCLPRNPFIKVLRWRIESNLAKIHSNRNFAGMARQLQPYATPVDPKKAVQQVTAGALESEDYIPTLPPPVYRYSFLLERAKALALSAQQLENAALSAIKDGEEMNYRIMQARQDVQLERANVSLQGLRVKEANDGLNLARKQKTRTEDQFAYYETLVQEGVSASEAMALQCAILAAQLAGITLTSGGGLTGPSGSVSYTPSAVWSSLSSVLAMQASYDRRGREWEFQRDLARDDMSIADAGITLADDRILITEKERDIAALRLEGAGDTVEFLQDRFTSAALYRWMSKNLRRLYREQLNMAISTARAAQRAMEFERQTSLDFIAYDYWDESRSGLVGAARLFNDLEKMNQYRLSSATRKKEIEKTISLAAVMPAEFQRFRRTGVLDFETSAKWFDRDFPGHYLRLIRDVSITVLALIPPQQGIRATLSNPGISRVMVGAPFEQHSTIYRLPESIALSGASKVTGLFELSPNDPMLFPFEGSGVATTWRLEMPKGANLFDFDSLYDVLLTVHYTALEDRDYRSTVLADMGQDEEGYVKTGAVRYFSLRNDFADQWYHLMNPKLGLPTDRYWDPDKETVASGKPQKPYWMVLDLSAADFVPNEERRSIKKITLAAQLNEGQELTDWCVSVSTSFKPALATGFASADATKLRKDGLMSAVNGFNGKRPYGRWLLNFIECNGQPNAGPTTDNKNAEPITDKMAKELRAHLRDLWLIIEYEAAVHYNR